MFLFFYLSDIWKEHRDTKIFTEKLLKYRPVEEDSSEESTDDEFDDERDENEGDASDEDNETEMKTDNPYALLADD